jgi:hypothetical protein
MKENAMGVVFSAHEKMINTSKILVGSCEGNRAVEKSGRTCDDITKVDRRKLGLDLSGPGE